MDIRRAVPMLALSATLAVACAPLPHASAGPDVAGEPAAVATVDSDLAGLERAFWACDYVATTRGVGATPIAACRHATESLKRAKFGGSFAAMLEWWKRNKAAEHSRLAHLD